jgi:hypothetical protein
LLLRAAERKPVASLVEYGNTSLPICMAALGRHQKVRISSRQLLGFVFCIL